MEPVTLALLCGIHLANKLRSRNGSSPTTAPASATTCRMCGDPINSEFNITRCCHNTLCQPCTPKWKRAGGTDCVLCGKTHA